MLASSVCGVATGTGLFLMTASLFILPTQEEFGWSTTQVAIAPLVLMLTAILSPFVGMATDRIGGRPIAIAGLVGVMIGCIWLGFVSDSLLLYYAGAVWIGITMPMTTGLPYLRAIAGWFERNVGLAFGITQSAASFAGIIGMPLVGFVIASAGWRAGYLLFAGLILLVGLPMVIAFFRENPRVRPTGQVPSSNNGASTGAALRDRRMWILVASFALATTAIGAISVHLAPILVAGRFSLEAAALIGTAYAAGMLIGRIAGGFLLDRFWPPAIPFVFALLSAIGAVLLMTGGLSTPAAIAAILLVGLTHGVEGDILAFFVLRLFGLKSFSSLVGIMTMIMAACMALGGIAAAMTIDAGQTYSIVCLVCALLFLASGLIILALGRVEQFKADEAHSRLVPDGA